MKSKNSFISTIIHRQQKSKKTANKNKRTAKKHASFQTVSSISGVTHTSEVHDKITASPRKSQSVSDKEEGYRDWSNVKLRPDRYITIPLNSHYNHIFMPLVQDSMSMEVSKNPKEVTLSIENMVDDNSASNENINTQKPQLLPMQEDDELSTNTESNVASVISANGATTSSSNNESIVLEDTKIVDISTMSLREQVHYHFNTHNFEISTGNALVAGINAKSRKRFVYEELSAQNTNIQSFVMGDKMTNFKTFLSDTNKDTLSINSMESTGNNAILFKEKENALELMFAIYDVLFGTPDSNPEYHMQKACISQAMSCAFEASNEKERLSRFLASLRAYANNTIFAFTMSNIVNHLCMEWDEASQIVFFEKEEFKSEMTFVHYLIAMYKIYMNCKLNIKSKGDTAKTTHVYICNSELILKNEVVANYYKNMAIKARVCKMRIIFLVSDISAFILDRYGSFIIANVPMLVMLEQDGKSAKFLVEREFLPATDAQRLLDIKAGNGILLTHHDNEIKKYIF